ncbi:MAG TPA: GWxTD domain-containing protein [Bacteroidota bacterium]|nr:GWxTD domain-containing protein [Bacteroidota bacterium]
MTTRVQRLLVTLFFCASFLHAQTASNSFVLNVDYARFQYDQQSGYVEVYYGFYPRLVTLEQSGGVFRGGVLLQVRLLNATTGEVLKHERSLLPIAVADTSGNGTRSTFISQAGYQLPFGEYRLHVLATDSLQPSRQDSIDVPISVKPYGSEPALSDLELCSEIKSSDDKTNAFYKNSLEVVPNATLVFGVTSSPVVFHYLELYNLDPNRQYALKSQVIDGSRKVVKETSKPRKFGVRNAVDVGMVNVASVSSGKYHLVVSLLDEGGKVLHATNKTFYIYNPHIQPTQVSAAALKASELAGMTADELAAEFRKAQYVAADEDIRTFAKLTTEEARREFLSKFWAEVEKGKPGKNPVRRSDYLQRISIANQRYGNQTREGWTTDRGRVYILYGDPDEIERLPSQSNAKPHEIWHYYQIENGVEFVFVDRSGFSEYILVHSTKRGEIRDDEWKRLLQ